VVSCEHVLVDNGKQVYYYAFTYLGCLFLLLTIKKFRLCHYITHSSYNAEHKVVLEICRMSYFKTTNTFNKNTIKTDSNLHCFKIQCFKTVWNGALLYLSCQQQQQNEMSASTLKMESVCSSKTHHLPELIMS